MAIVDLSPKTVIDATRKFLRDTPKLNELKGIEETDDDVYKLAINMAISDWNSTPPLLTHVGLVDFPSFDWLIIATAMFVLQSAGVLQYRNELPFNDAGTTVSPWSKGPQYFNVAGMWANMVETKKRDFKYALNVGKTWGMARSSEFLMWDYSGLYTGVPGDNVRGGAGVPFPIIGGQLGQAGMVLPPTPSKSNPFEFGINTWLPDNDNMQWYITYFHNLQEDVDVRIVDPNKVDIKNQMQIRFGQNNIKIAVPMAPDGRLVGTMIVYKI